MNELELYEKMEKVQTAAEAVQLLADNGINVSADEFERFVKDFSEKELGESELDEVAGGFIGTVIKYASSAGILCRAYYDTVKYNNATRTYSADQIYGAAATWGIK